jgi:hypothetical protein
LIWCGPTPKNRVFSERPRDYNYLLRKRRITVIGLECNRHCDEHAACHRADHTDSASIREHATEALEHIDAAKAANAANPDTIKHLEHSEADLNAAVNHARRYNSSSAGEDADDARHQLEQIEGKEGEKAIGQ